MTLSEALAVQKSGLAAKIDISLIKEIAFGIPGAMLGKPIPRPWEWQKITSDSV